MAQKIICLVTMHGMGFQQAPADGAPGYADALHEHLADVLGDLLGDDPNRSRPRRSQAGPVYVQSHWPPPTYESSELGLSRLGVWDASGRIDASKAPLVQDGLIGHVALVYSHLEGIDPQVGPLLEITGRALSSAKHYIRPLGLLELAWRAAAAERAQPRAERNAPTPSLQVRSNVPGAPQDTPPPPTGLLGTLRALENDVATYVVSNELRERVRGFLREALLRLAYREDVAGLVVNLHSQGTVAGYDTVRDLPTPMLPRVRHVVTAGSPLRKYVALFGWGNDVGGLREVGSWTNFWDANDPVADPLDPPASWRWGAPPSRRPDQLGLFQRIDPATGQPQAVPIGDVLVDNVRHSYGGGLPAHNYWDNQAQFVPALAEILRAVAQPGRNV